MEKITGKEISMRELDFYHEAVKNIKKQMDSGKYNEIAFYQAWKYLRTIIELVERNEQIIKELEKEKRENFNLYQEAVIDKRMYRKAIENLLNGERDEAKKYIGFAKHREGRAEG